MVRHLCATAILLTVLSSAAPAQDVRGLEACGAEKQMERRTGCLQANIEFLHQALLKQTRENNGKLSAATRELAAAKAEIAALRAVLVRLEGELAQMKTKAEPPAKK